MSCSIGTVSGWLWPGLPGSLPWARLVVVTVLRLCSVGRVAELFSWDCHLCVSACVWICLVHTYLYGSVVSGEVWVGHPPVHMHVVSISRLFVPWCVLHICMPVSECGHPMHLSRSAAKVGVSTTISWIRAGNGQQFWKVSMEGGQSPRPHLSHSHNP